MVSVGNLRQPSCKKCCRLGGRGGLLRMHTETKAGGRIGLFGGSFDPIHHGHLILAREAREKLGLDTVVFLPARISPHKLDRPPAPAEWRLRMVQAAIRDEQGFLCDDRELWREGPSFAIDTVREYRAAHPGAELFYFIGDDNTEALHTWKEIDALRREVTFIVLARGGAGEVAVSRKVEISSSEIRKRVASGLSVRYLLPEVVCAMILQNGLYRND